MRRRWPALAATIPLVLVGAVAIAHPASAAPLGGTARRSGQLAEHAAPEHHRHQQQLARGLASPWPRSTRPRSSCPNTSVSAINSSGASRSATPAALDSPAPDGSGQAVRLLTEPSGG